MAQRQYGQLYPVARAVLRPTSQFLWRVHVTGLGNLPEGRAVMCPNHISFLDSAFLMLNLPRRITYVGKAEYLDSWKTKYLFPAVGMIPIDRSGGSASASALDTAARVLERDELFGIFPEGTRSRTGKLYRGRTGAARLALRTNAPLVPVGIRGTSAIQPPDAPMPRGFLSCQINIGEPIQVERYQDRAEDRLVLRQLIDEVMYNVRLLSGQEYVDQYAGAKTAEGVPTARPGEPADPREAGQPSAREGVPPVSTNGDGRVGERREGDTDSEVEIVEVVEQPRSSAEVLAKWWS